MHTGMTAMLRTALISVTCIQAVMSVFTFIAGIVCYHYISQRWRASADTNKQSESQKEMESDLELKENAAYITLHPRT
jgi:TRAP-type C4-dicarboxylate transport system permease small subunit